MQGHDSLEVSADVEDWRTDQRVQPVCRSAPPGASRKISAGYSYYQSYFGTDGRKMSSSWETLSI